MNRMKMITVTLLLSAITLIAGQAIVKEAKCSDYDVVLHARQMIKELMEQQNEIRQSFLMKLNEQGNAHFTIAFYAKLSSTLEGLTPGQVLKFSDVITNIGRAYNPKTGKFVAPRAGTYRFDWSYLVHKGYYTFVCGYVNSKMIQRTAINNQSDEYSMASGFMIVQLKKKDEVSLKSCNKRGYIYQSYSMFGGHMI